MYEKGEILSKKMSKFSEREQNPSRELRGNQKVHHPFHHPSREAPAEEVADQAASDDLARKMGEDPESLLGRLSGHLLLVHLLKGLLKNRPCDLLRHPLLSKFLCQAATTHMSIQKARPDPSPSEGLIIEQPPGGELLENLCDHLRLKPLPLETVSDLLMTSRSNRKEAEGDFEGPLHIWRGRGSHKDYPSNRSNPGILGRSSPGLSQV